MKYKNKFEYKIRKFGPVTERRDYSVTKQTLDVPDFLETPKKSFEWFKKEGIEEVLREHYPITSTNKKISLAYKPNSFYLDYDKNEYEQVKLAKAKGTNYAAKVKATFTTTIEETGEVNEAEVLLGEIPLMTSGASFIINGSEKVVVSQLIRSPGAYFGRNVRNKQSDDLFNKVEILPRLGSWVEIYHKVTSHNPDTVKIKIDKNKNVNLMTFLGALGFDKKDVNKLFGNSAVLENTIKREKNFSTLESKEEITKACQQLLFNTLRKGDRPSEEASANLISGMLFHKKRYSLSATGRHMLNTKLNLVDRISGTYLAEDLVKHGKNRAENEILLEKNTYIDQSTAIKIQNYFNEGTLSSVEIDGVNPNIVYGKLLDESNADIAKDLKKRIKIIKLKVYPNRRSLISGLEPVLVIGNDPKSQEHHLLISDIIATIGYYFNLLDGIGQDDDPDSLVNKRIVSVGELLQNQFVLGVNKLEKTTRERMSSKEPSKINPKNVTNNKLISNQLKTFFNSSKLSQFMDQINPLAEISTERRITSLGPGGLNRDTAQFEVRDVHATHYGRICPIETPEGQNIGLILNFATYTKVDKYGLLQSPYFRVNNGVVDYSAPVYLSASQEIGFNIAQSTTRIDAKTNKILDEVLTVRRDYNYIMTNANEVDYIEVASKQMTSIAASAIPFLENDDANRALMGANMQRQAVPLIQTEAPLVATGIEADIAKYSSANLSSGVNGRVEYVSGDKIKIKKENSETTVTYKLKIFQRSNQGTVISQKPIVKVGQEVKKGDLLVDGPSFKNGELALGKNVLVAFSTYHGYNYEDAVILNERLVKDDVFTSIHIEEQIIQFRSSRAGDDKLTSDIPNVSKFTTRHLDEHGIVKIGSEVIPGDILVGRVSPKGDDNPSQEEKLLLAILQQRPLNVKDTSLKVKNGHSGTVIGVEILDRKNNDQLEDGIEKIVKVFIAQKRKIKVGDKMSGRHGNKGVVSIVLPEEDMPYLEDGTPVDVILNPQGVPSRMNIGQVLELHLGMAARKLNCKFVTPVFDGIKKEEIEDVLLEAGVDPTGKQYLIDPITGNKTDKPVSIGVMYMLKLNHMVDDKMHSRSVGPYSLISQQPLGGKSQNGGQRFGEMETWALESYGATNVLQEILTYKSDDIEGRNQLYASLASGKDLPRPGVPESFNVLSYELKGLGLKLVTEEIDEKSREENYEQYFDNTKEGGLDE